MTIPYDSAGCGKTISAEQIFDGLHVWDKGRTPAGELSGTSETR